MAKTSKPKKASLMRVYAYQCGISTGYGVAINLIEEAIENGSLQHTAGLQKVIDNLYRFRKNRIDSSSSILKQTIS